MSNDHMISDRIAKLPHWVQQYIAALERQRDSAVKQLRDFTDEQTPQPFFVDEMACIKKGAPESFRRYVHCHRINFNHRGLSFSLTMRERGVTLQYGQEGGLRDILCQPTSFQTFEIQYPENEK